MAKLIRVSRFFLLLLLGLIFYSGQVLAVLEIKVREEVEVRQEWIKLLDLAEIKGASQEEMAKLESIQLGKALLPGYTKKIPREQLVLALQDKGFQLEDLKLEIPSWIKVTTASRQVSGEELQLFAEDYLYKLFAELGDKLIINLKHKPGDLVLPDQEYRLEVINEAEKKLGNLSLQLGVIVDGELYRKVFLSYEIGLWQDVYVAKRNLARGEQVSPTDFSLETKKVFSLDGKIITDLNNPLVMDSVFRVPVAKGEILTSDLLIQPVLIRSGDIVTAEVIIGNIKVSTPVKAKERGKKGEYITVENLETGYRFKAQVIDSHLVRVRGR